MPEPKHDTISIPLTPMGRLVGMAAAAIGVIIGLMALADKAADAIKIPEKYLELKVEQSSLKERVAVMEREMAKIGEKAENAKVLADDAQRAVQTLEIDNARKGGPK